MLSLPKLEDRENFEIATRGLKARCSASELPVHFSKKVVRVVGVEPTCLKAKDFKSSMYTVPSHPLH